MKKIIIIGAAVLAIGLVVGLVVVNTGSSNLYSQGSTGHPPNTVSSGGTTAVLGKVGDVESIPPPPSGYTTVWGDGFPGTAGTGPNGYNWMYDVGVGGSFGTGEIETMGTNLANGHLDGVGNLNMIPINSGTAWTSSRIETLPDYFQAPPGGKMEVTASIAQPNPAQGLGYWPAFWMMGAGLRQGGSWPTIGEVDIMEGINGLGQASQTLHSAQPSFAGTYTQGSSNTQNGHALIACPSTGNCDDGFHTYSVIIDRTNTSAEFLQFLMDGVVETTVNEATVGTNAWQLAIDHGFFIILDMAMGGGYPNGICSCTTPTSTTTSGSPLVVKYVAVYETGNLTAPCGPGCTYPQTVLGTGTATQGGLCFALFNNQQSGGERYTVATCDGSAGQKISPRVDGSVQVIGGCIDVAGASKLAGALIAFVACNGTVAQVFTFDPSGEIINPNSGMCITNTGGPGAQLVQEPCTAAANQLWAVSTPPFVPLSVSFSKVGSNCVLSWFPPSNNGGSPITGYNLQISDSLNGYSTSTVITPNTTFHGVSGETWTAQVSAITAIAQGPLTSSISCTQ